jgi:hypothetical protein
MWKSALNPTAAFGPRAGPFLRVGGDIMCGAILRTPQAILIHSVKQVLEVIMKRARLATVSVRRWSSRRVTVSLIPSKEYLYACSKKDRHGKHSERTNAPT